MKKLWFKRKWFGWGWRPASIEGWLVTILFLVIAILWSIYFDPAIPGNALIWPVGLLLLVATLITIAYKTGETPKWSWGKPK